MKRESFFRTFVLALAVLTVVILSMVLFVHTVDAKPVDYSQLEVPGDAVELGDGSLTWTLEDGTVVTKAPSKDPVKKTRTPVVSKTVRDGVGNEWVESRSASVGEVLTFRLEGTVPEGLDEYDMYFYQFVDKPSEGITVDVDSIFVSLRPVNGDVKDVSEFFEVVTSDLGEILITCKDLKVIEGVSDDDIIVVEYDACLNESAHTGLSETNDNFVKIVHTFWVRDDRVVESREDKVSIVTWRLDVLKVAKGTDTPLMSAVFTISQGDMYLNTDIGWVREASATKFASDLDGMFHVAGLGEGEYLLHEVLAPDGYQPVKDVILNIATEKSDDDTKLVATCKGATVGNTDAEAGIINLRIEDQVDTTNRIIENLPKTGAERARLVMIVGLGLLFVIISVRAYLASKKSE